MPLDKDARINRAKDAARARWARERKRRWAIVARLGHVFVYALAHPKTGTVRFVGVAKAPYRRLYGRAPQDDWVRRLRGKGLWPKVVILEEAPESQAVAAQLRWAPRLRPAAASGR